MRGMRRPFTIAGAILAAGFWQARQVDSVSSGPARLGMCLTRTNSSDSVGAVSAIREWG
jgi:hypothetical protein